jgi:hypothetical protein
MYFAFLFLVFLMTVIHASLLPMTPTEFHCFDQEQENVRMYTPIAKGRRTFALAENLDWILTLKPKTPQIMDEIEIGLFLNQVKCIRHFDISDTNFVGYITPILRGIELDVFIGIHALELCQNMDRIKIWFQEMLDSMCRGTSCVIFVKDISLSTILVQDSFNVHHNQLVMTDFSSAEILELAKNQNDKYPFEFVLKNLMMQVKNKCH